MSMSYNNYVKFHGQPFNRDEDASKCRIKLQRLKTLIKEMVFENAALCDEICDVREQTLIRMEERKFLLRKLCQFDPQVLSEVQRIINAKFPPGGANAEKKSTKKKSGDAENKPKPRKSASKAKKKIVEVIPLDATGRPIFPITLGTLTVHSLGDVVSEHPEFHTAEAIFPVGFLSTRIYASIEDPTISCMYTCKITDASGVPRFEISPEHDPSNPIIGGSPNICHAMLLQKINESLGLSIISTRPKGNEFFGLVHPTILNLIQSSQGTRKCANYKWSKFEVSKSGERHVEDPDPCLNFDALQNCISYQKYKMTSPMLPDPADNILEKQSFSDFVDLL